MTRSRTPRTSRRHGPPPGYDLREHAVLVQKLLHLWEQRDWGMAVNDEISRIHRERGDPFWRADDEARAEAALIAAGRTRPPPKPRRPTTEDLRALEAAQIRSDYGRNAMAMMLEEWPELADIDELDLPW